MRNEGDSLTRYRTLVATHSTRIRPRLEALRREVDTQLSQIHRAERDNLKAQAEALSALRKNLGKDARFLLREGDFSVFAARLTSPPPWLGADLGEGPSPDPLSWRLLSVPHALSIRNYLEREEPGFDDEHDCIRELSTLDVVLGPAGCSLELERGRVSLVTRRDPDPFCQYHEVAFQLEASLGPLGLPEAERRLVAREASCAVCYALPILRLRPTAVDFTYP